MKRSLIVVVALAAAACIVPTDACGCTPAMGVGTVAGVVTRAGAPVSDAEVRVETRLRGCALSAPNETIGQLVARTDAAGRYRFAVTAPSPTDTACLRVVARAPGVGDSASVDGLRMRLVPSWGTRDRPDSLRVDLRLP